MSQQLVTTNGNQLMSYAHIIGSETTRSSLRGTDDVLVGTSDNVSMRGYVSYPLTITSCKAVGSLSASKGETIKRDSC